MRIFLVRHGETEENRRHIRQGKLPGKTSAFGKEENKLVANRLKDVQLDAAYCSDQRRARDTLKAIMAFHPGLRRVETAELRERGCGVYEGRPKDEYRQARRKSNRSFGKFKPRGGESLQEVQQRARRFYDKLLADHQRDAVLVVGHGAFFSTLLLFILEKGLTDENYHAFLMDNTGVTTIEARGKMTTVQEYNSTSHLSALPVQR